MLKEKIHILIDKQFFRIALYAFLINLFLLFPLKSYAQENTLWNSGNFGGPVYYGKYNGNDLFFSQGRRLYKADLSGDNIEAGEANFYLQQALAQFEIEGDNFYAIYPLNSEYQNNIVKSTFSNPNSANSTDFSQITNGIKKFKVINGYVLLAHNKDGEVCDKLVGNDYLNGVETDFEYEQEFIDFTINGSIAFLVTSNGSIKVIDFSDKTEVTEAASINVANAVAVYCSGNHLYVACDNGDGLKIYDVSNPSAPALAGEYETGSFTQIVVNGTTAYLSNKNRFTTIDVSDVSAPTYLDERVISELSDNVLLTDANNDKICYSDNGIFGLIDAATFTIDKQYLCPVSSEWVHSDGTTLVVYDKLNYYFHSLENTFDPQVFAALAVDEEPIDFRIDGNNFFVATINKIEIYDIENLTSPPTVYNLAGEFLFFEIYMDIIAVSGISSTNGLHINDHLELIDISDMSNPTQLYLQANPVAGRMSSFEFNLYKDVLYVSSEDDEPGTDNFQLIWLTTIDISTLTAPKIITTMELADAQITKGKDVKLSRFNNELYLLTNYLTLNNYYAAKIFAYALTDSLNPALISGVQVTESEYNNVAFLKEMCLVTVPADEVIHMYRLEGEVLLRKKWIQEATIPIETEANNLTLFSNPVEEVQAAALKNSKAGIVVKGGEGDLYEYYTSYGSEKTKGTKIRTGTKTKTEEWKYTPPNPTVKKTLSTSVLPSMAAQDGCSVNPTGGKYNLNDNVSITASSSSGWKFDLWSGDASGSNTTVSVKMDKDRNVIGNFQPILTLSLTSPNPENYNPPTKLGEEIYIATANVFVDGVDWELKAITFTAVGKARAEHTEAILKVRGKDYKGSIVPDGDGNIASINFTLNEIIKEGETLPLDFSYRFYLPSRLNGFYAPAELDEVKKLGVSTSITKLTCTPIPVAARPGIKSPLTEFISTQQTMAAIWNVSLSPREPFETIQKAIDSDKTKDGHTIEVSDGKFQMTSETNISKNLTIKSQHGPTKTILDPFFDDELGAVLNCHSNENKIEGFTIDAYGYATGIYSNFQLTIDNCIIKNASNSGVDFYKGSLLKISNSEIFGCNLSGIDITGESLEASGWNDEIEAMVQISSTKIYDNKMSGISSIDHSISFSGSGTEIYNNGHYGIFIEKRNLEIKDNAVSKISDNKKGGIKIGGYLEIGAGLTIENNGGHGIELAEPEINSSLQDIIINNNSGDGIHYKVDEKKNARLRFFGNLEITNNKLCGIRTDNINLIIWTDQLKIDKNGEHGLKIRNGKINVASNEGSISENNYSGIYTDKCKDITLKEKIIIEKNKDCGILVTNGEKLTLKDIKANHNSYSGIYFDAENFNPASDEANVAIFGSENEFTYNNSGGIYSKNGNITIIGTGTKVFENKSWGIATTTGNIFILEGAMTEVYLNGNGIGVFKSGKIILPSGFKIDDNAGTGLLAYGSQELTFHNLKVRSNGRYGIYTYSKHLEITGDDIEINNNNYHGIYINDGSVKISGAGAELCKNGGWGIFSDGSWVYVLGTYSKPAQVNYNNRGGIYSSGQVWAKNIDLFQNKRYSLKGIACVHLKNGLVFGHDGFGIKTMGHTEILYSKVYKNSETGIQIDNPNYKSDLDITINSESETSQINSDINYQVVAKNNGPETDKQVFIDILIPSGLKYVSAAANKGKITQSNNMVYCEIEKLELNEEVTIDITLNAVSEGSAILEARIDGDALDKFRGNNISKITTNIISAAYLAFSENSDFDHQNFMSKITLPTFSEDNYSALAKIVSQKDAPEETHNKISIIENSVIEENGNIGIIFDGVTDISVTNSNIINNAPYAIENRNIEIPITTRENFWGSSEGPVSNTSSSNGFSGNVVSSNWMSEKISLVVESETDTILASYGSKDSVICFIKNWANNNSEVFVTITDDNNWLLNETNYSATLNDSSGIALPIIFESPENATEFVNKIYIEASLKDNPETISTDTIVVKMYKSIATNLVLTPDSSVIAIGETLQYSAQLTDQNGKILTSNITWEATGGTITNDGLFKADSSEGEGIVTATDLGSQLTSTVCMLISGGNRVLESIVIIPDTIKLNPNDGIKLKAKGYDKNGFEINISAVWSTDGGKIDSLGYFVAPNNKGFFTIVVTDTTTDISGYAYVEVGNVTDVINENVLPEKYALNQNYPNPFNPSTVVSYKLPVNSLVNLHIYNVLGQRVATLADNKSISAGTYKQNWNASTLSSGVYFIMIDAKGISSDKEFHSVKKMMLLR